MFFSKNEFILGISDVSVALSPNGWAWLVHGRRLVVWRYAKSNTHKPFSANCRELTLPPSDLAHNAKLVNVFATNQNQTPSCIAVSPEGIVRYWPSIGMFLMIQYTSQIMKNGTARSADQK